MGVYRCHPGGMYSPLSETRKQAEMLKFYRAMDKNLGFRYHRLISTAISRYFFEWAEEHERRGELEQARVCLRTCLSARPINPRIPLRKLLKMGLGLAVSGLFARGARPGNSSP